jgi:glycerol-3-phosphate acyltransferase PlsY
MSPLVVPSSFVFGYLLGSIPFGLVLSWLTGSQDPRTIGSRNIGATNVLRTGNKGLAALTLAGDMLKGTAAVLLVRLLYDTEAAMAAGIGAFLGHLFPLWLQFKGGKGVATYIGVALGLAWPAALVFAAVWIAVAALTRYSSLAALVASLVMPAFVWWRGEATLALLFAFMTALLWFMHRQNIARLFSRTEGRIGGSS